MIDVEQLLQRQRTEIAGQIHDQIIPPLFAARMLLEALSARLRGNDSQCIEDRTAVAESVSRSAELVIQSMMAARQVLSGISPPVNGSRYWQQQIELVSELLRSYCGGDRQPIQLIISGTYDWDNCPDSFSVAITDVVTEAIRNAARHSAASRIEVSLQSQPSRLIRVVDNGTGFEVDKVHASHGLTLMKSRADSIGAKLRIDSRPGGPTQVELVMD